MLHLIPRPLHRLAYRAAHGLRKLWWRVRRPRVTGCRVLAFDSEGHVLLVRHSYGSGTWMPPGGGLGRGEDPLVGGARELHEETGCIVTGLREVTRVEEPLQGATNVVHVLTGLTAGTPAADGREIVEARFFAPAALPEPMSERMRADLPKWLALCNGPAAS